LIVQREEYYSIRVSPSGEIVIPRELLARLLAEANKDDHEGLTEDLEDFGLSAIVIVQTVECDSGTGLTIQRDRRHE
jgi:hypothetical protein